MDVFEWVTIGFVSIVGVILVVSQFKRAGQWMDEWSDENDDDMLW